MVLLFLRAQGKYPLLQGPELYSGAREGPAGRTCPHSLSTHQSGATKGDWPRELQAPFTFEEFPSSHTEVQTGTIQQAFPASPYNFSHTAACSLLSLSLNVHRTEETPSILCLLGVSTPPTTENPQVPGRQSLVSALLLQGSPSL